MSAFCLSVQFCGLDKQFHKGYATLRLHGSNGPIVPAQVANSLFMFPMPASKAHPGVQTILQGFSWTEAARQADLAQRNLLLGLHVKV